MADSKPKQVTFAEGAALGRAMIHRNDMNRLAEEWGIERKPEGEDASLDAALKQAHEYPD